MFHPKIVLLLYRGHARLQIGSGNLTFAGYSGNTELFLCLELAYDNDAHAALLLSIDELLNRILGWVRRSGTQLALFREELPAASSAPYVIRSPDGRPRTSGLDQRADHRTARRTSPE